MLEKRSYLSIKYGATKSLFMWHMLNKSLSLVLISEFPKSGGSWLAQLMSASLDIPFYRNRAPELKESVMHGHYKYNANFNKILYVVRDGRDVMVSAYYYWLIPKENNNNYVGDKWRKKLNFHDPMDIERNLPTFIEFFHKNYKVLGENTRWQDHVEYHLNNPNVHIIRYEDLHKNAELEIKSAAAFLNKPIPEKIDLKQVVDQYSFQKQSSRVQGQEDAKSFLRKGIIGDWKNKFTAEAADVFHSIAGETLIKLNYETGPDWVKEFS